jgi:hypothetical protein
VRTSDVDPARTLRRYAAGLLTLGRESASLRTPEAAPKLAAAVRAIDDLRQHVNATCRHRPRIRFLVVAGPAGAIDTIERAAAHAKRVTGSHSPSRNLAFICEIYDAEAKRKETKP